MERRITRSVQVRGDVLDVYRLWEDFASFPKFMKHIKSIELTGRDTSHWAMEGPLGKIFEWDARVTARDPGRRIEWESFQGDLETSGEVSFRRTSNDQTDVTVSLAYQPLGAEGRGIAEHLFEDPERRLEEDLQNFRLYAEERLGVMR